jgi:hypothetical protein
MAGWRHDEGHRAGPGSRPGHWGACTAPGPWPHGPPTASASWRLAGSPGIVRSGPATLPDEPELAASRLLELLRPAA